MNLSLSFKFFFLIIALSALSLVFASDSKSKFYIDLEEKHNALILEIKGNNPIVVDVLAFSHLTPPTNGWLKLFYNSNYLKEHRYYHSKKLIAIDNFDEGGKLVRRDFIFNDTIRIQHFFNVKESLIKKDWIDENQKIFNSKNLVIPLTNMRSGY